MSTVLDDICAYADRKLKGSTLTFALLAWVKGQAGNKDSVALSAPPASQVDAPLALLTTAYAADRAQGLPQIAGPWRPIAEARKDSTPYLLLVDYRDEDSEHAIDDAPFGRTIGHNSDDNTGENEGWKFAGWCWDHDHYVQGKGVPIAFMELPEAERFAAVREAQA